MNGSEMVIEVFLRKSGYLSRTQAKLTKMVIFQRQKSSVNLKKKTKKRRVLNMNKNAATEREYEFSYDTLVDIITAQQALIE